MKNGFAIIALGSAKRKKIMKDARSAIKIYFAFFMTIMMSDTIINVVKEKFI